MDDEIEPVAKDRAPLPFEGLDAPLPLTADPPPAARWLAFSAILIGGLLGAMVGFGVGDVMAGDPAWAAVGSVAGAVTGAAGVGVVANLTLRAMGEWQAVDHPEDERAGRTGRRHHWDRRSR